MTHYIKIEKMSQDKSEHISHNHIWCWLFKENLEVHVSRSLMTLKSNKNRNLLDK